MDTIDLEIIVAVNAYGEYRVGTADTESPDVMLADDGCDTKNVRTIKLTLTVQKPDALEMTATLPDDLTPSGEVSLKVA